MKLIQHLKQTNKTHIYGTNIWSFDIYKLPIEYSQIPHKIHKQIT